MPRVRRCRYPGCHQFAMMPNHYCQAHIKYEQAYRERHERWLANHKEDKHTVWKYNHITRYRNPIKAKQNKFYHSKAWRSLRAEALKRDYHLCQYCQTNPGNTVDHILPIEAFPQEMADLGNLATICRECHRKKTKWEEYWYGLGLHNKRTGNPGISDVKLINKLMNAREGS